MLAKTTHRNDVFLTVFQGLSTHAAGEYERSFSCCRTIVCQDRLGTETRHQQQCRNKQNTRTPVVFFFPFFLFFLLRRVLLGSAVAMGGLRLALEKLRRPPRPHQQAEV
eukprot:COSAG06_NODE_2808_length_6249_cov_12.456585_5_plen_109_part_00